jgi:putative (di)nucleoside polyphosphate hydrolase
MFKRGVYGRALQHLAPLARLAAGAQAVPQMLLDACLPELGMARPAKRSGYRSPGKN